ncbi:MAG: FAD-dependent oxidoreductase [Patescibacteria group bacterium]
MSGQVEEKFIILGAGPAGLAAGYELAKNGKKVVLIEKDDGVGGLSRTKKYQGHYFDLGPHRFFTKNNEVESLWRALLGNDFLELPRLTRIYYKKNFYHYPLQPVDALYKLGLVRSVWVIGSLLKTKFKNLFFRKPEASFEDWVTNRFGSKLFSIFFKSYTEKLWGISTRDLGADWAVQRIKNLSLISAIKNAIFGDEHGKVKSLIERFNYPKRGAGMMYEKMAENIKKLGGEIIYNANVKNILHDEDKVSGVIIEDQSGERQVAGDYIISSLALNDMIRALSPLAPENVLRAAENLRFRSLVIVYLVVEASQVFPDNWVYVHEPDLKVTRVQDTSSFGPYLSENKNQTMVCLEYACWSGDALWSQSDDELVEMGKRDIAAMGLLGGSRILDGLVGRIPYAYPVYAFNYEDNLKIIFDYLGQFKNFQTVGRSGLFHYNNMDHSILTGIFAARNFMGSNYDVYKVNAEADYHECKLP